MSVTMLIAYCETSVKWLSKNVPPMPPTMVRMPMPRGSPAAMTDAKIRTSNRSVTGSVTYSARCRSDSRVVLKAWLTGTKPVPVTVRVPEWTFERRSP